MTDTAPARLEAPAAVNPAHVRWRVDSDPRTDQGQIVARFVAYITQERLADMLDAWVGVENWWPEYEQDGPAMWCRITVRNPVTGELVTKPDVGDMGDSFKSAVSDAFKRCATRAWGVGREVRHIPSLWAPCRAYQRGGKDIAVANNQTIPTLNRKLADLGFAGWSTAVDEIDDTEPGHHSDGAQTAAPPAPTRPGAAADREEAPPDPSAAGGASDPPTIKNTLDEIADWIGAHGRQAPEGARKIDLLRIVSEIVHESTNSPTQETTT